MREGETPFEQRILPKAISVGSRQRIPKEFPNESNTSIDGIREGKYADSGGRSRLPAAMSEEEYVR